VHTQEQLKDNKTRTDAKKDDWQHEVIVLYAFRLASTVHGARMRAHANEIVLCLQNHDDHEGLDEASLKEHEEVTKIKNVNKIQVHDRLHISRFPLRVDLFKSVHMCTYDKYLLKRALPLG